MTSHTSISLRWHYPNQVMGQSNTAYSQPASASTPFLRFLLYYSSDNLQSFFRIILTFFHISAVVSRYCPATYRGFVRHNRIRRGHLSSANDLAPPQKRVFLLHHAKNTCPPAIHILLTDFIGYTREKTPSNPQSLQSHCFSCFFLQLLFFS